MARIGLIGAECTGKTTLLRLLREHTELPVIEELVREVVRELGYERPQDVEDVVAAQKLYLEAQINRQLRYRHFVSDRTPLDNSAYMVLYAAHEMSTSEVGAFLDRARQHTMAYDLLVYFPIMWDEVEDDGFRHVDLAGRRAIQDIVLGLVEDFEVSHLVYEVKSNSPHDRLLEVIAELQKRNIVI